MERIAKKGWDKSEYTDGTIDPAFRNLVIIFVCLSLKSSSFLNPLVLTVPTINVLYFFIDRLDYDLVWNDIQESIF